MEEGGGRGWQRDDGQQDAVASIQGEECRTGMRLVLILDVEGIHKARILELVLPLEKRRDVEESNAVGIESEDRPCFNVCEKERKKERMRISWSGFILVFHHHLSFHFHCVLSTKKITNMGNECCKVLEVFAPFPHETLTRLAPAW